MRGAAMPIRCSVSCTARSTRPTRSSVTSSIARRRLTCKVACAIRIASKQIIRNASSAGTPVQRATNDG